MKVSKGIKVLAVLAMLAGSVLYLLNRELFYVYDLRCEGLEEPLCLDNLNPHFSWKIQSNRPMEQAAWQIQAATSKQDLLEGNADLWDSKKVPSSNQIMVPYQGTPLASRTKVWWRVRVWNNKGDVSAWSAPRRFFTGIIGPDILNGNYIGAVPGDGRSPLLKKDFKVEDTVNEALLYVNSLGYHEAYINGVKVSDAVLTPAVSQLDKRSLIVAYDVSSLLKKGNNEIILWIGSGWYKSTTFGTAYDGPLVKAELMASIGTEPLKPVLWTDASWKGAWSGYRDTGNWRPHGFGGESIDPRVKPDWQPVDTVDVDIPATGQMCEPCRLKETMTAKEIFQDADGRWVADFGKVVNAMLDVKLPCLPEGQKVIAWCSDQRKEDDSWNFQGSNEYIASGEKDGDRFVNRFNHQVFRYVVFENLPSAPKASDIKALRMRTDYPLAGSFHCSDPDLNRIWESVAWTMENLAFDGYMVDCASIERLGYGGDGNASTLSLQLLADVAPLYLNWLTAWADAQRPDGGLPHTAPNPYTAGGGPYWCSFLIQASWRTYLKYGDRRPLERFYPQMKKWIGYADAYSSEGLLGRWPDESYRGWFLGDWAAPSGVDVRDPESVGLVSNCTMCQAFSALEKIALALGFDADAALYRTRYNDLKTKVHSTYYHTENGTYASGSQLDMAYPLLTGVVPRELKESVVAVLKERTSTIYNGHLATGLVGVPVITEWATINRECDWLYGLLKQKDYPGYLYMLKNGATGIWEEWDGGRSALHNCYNGIGSWFFQALGGIIPLESCNKMLIDPQIPHGLESVSVTQQSPYGLIVVNRNGKSLHIEIPVGVTAMVCGQSYGNGAYDIEL